MIIIITIFFNKVNTVVRMSPSKPVLNLVSTVMVLADGILKSD